MDADNPGPVADASQTNATSRGAKKRRRGSSPQDETVGESSRSKRKPTRSSQPTAQLFPPSLLLPPSHPGGGTAYSTLGPISILQYPYTSATHHQPSFPPPSVVWPLVPTTPATVHGGTPTCAEQSTGPVISPLVNYDLASVGFGGLPKGTSSSANSPSGSQPHPDSGAANSRPRLEDLPDPPATQRPSQTIRVLASAALQSEPMGKLTLEEIVDRVCSRFEYFQDLQIRAKLKKSIRHALSLYSEFRCSEDSEGRGARKVWRVTDEVRPPKCVRERKRKSRRTTVPGEIGQEERAQQEREVKIQYVVKESTCIGKNEDLEFVGIGRAGEKGKGSAPERSHSMGGVQPGEQTTPAPADANPKSRRLLHGAAARSTISQILADKERDDGDPMRSHSTSADESPPSIRLQEPRWGTSSLLPNTMQNALLQPPTTQPSPHFTRSAFGAYSTSFPAQNTEEYGAAILPGSSVSTRFRSFAKPGTVALKGFTSVEAPIAPPSAETGTESGQPIPDGDGS